MFASFRRRTLRRPVLILFLLSFVIFLAGYLKDLAILSAGPARVKTVRDSPLTVTRTRTAWAETTRVVVAAGAKGSRQQKPLSDNLAPPLQQHRYRSDGLLEVNPDGPHPIFELIQNAEAEWEAKVTKASKTLGEAVAEYERRYKRPPPLGFDDWCVNIVLAMAASLLTENRWTYVEENNVQLPDEYDQIYRDLEPFWGMDPKDLQNIETEWEGEADTYTIGKVADGPIKLVNYTLPGQEEARFDLAGGAFQIMELLEDVEEFIPPFRAIFSPHDNPNLHTDFELKTEALKHAAAGTCTCCVHPSYIRNPCSH